VQITTETYVSDVYWPKVQVDKIVIFIDLNTMK